MPGWRVREGREGRLASPRHSFRRRSQTQCGPSRCIGGRSWWPSCLRTSHLRGGLRSRHIALDLLLALTQVVTDEPVKAVRTAVHQSVDTGGIGFQVPSNQGRKFQLSVIYAKISDRGSPHIKMTSTERPRGPVSPNLRLGPSFRARARSGGATGLGGRAKRVARPVNFFSHLISDACMDAKYGRTREIFDRSPRRYLGTAVRT